MRIRLCRRSILPAVNILGINAYHGDASAAVLVDGQLVAAAEEERFSRVKHDASFPTRAIRCCLEEANVRPQDIDHLALSRNPRSKLIRRITFALGSRAGRRMARGRASNVVRL